MNILKRLWNYLYWGCDCHKWGYLSCGQCAPFTEEKLKYKLNQNEERE